MCGQPPLKNNNNLLNPDNYLAPLNQAYVCKTHHTAADMRLRETTKTTKTPKTT